MRCYIFDIDGTLADGEHRIHHIRQEPKDWRAYFAACGGDAPIPHMIRVLNTLYQAGETILFVSGRSDEVRAETEAWLYRHTSLMQRDIKDALFMRKAGDHRNDDVLKLELLAEIREAGYEPIMAFDDRNRVVAAWRSAGIPCAQVAEGDF